MKKTEMRMAYITAIICLLYLSSCSKYDEPGLIYNPQGSSAASTSPVITGIAPTGTAAAGVREITLVGQNFAVNGIDTNWIFVNGTSPIIKSVSSNQIVFYRPSIYGSQILITMAVPTAISSTHMYYNIEQPIEQFGDFTRTGRDLTVMDADKYGNLWIASKRYLFRLSEDGFYLNEVMTQDSIGSAMSPITDMKFGRGGNLYFITSSSSSSNYRNIFQINPSTLRRPTAYFAGNSTIGPLAKFDFDGAGNIYAGRNNGLIFIDTNRTATNTGLYPGVTLVEVRVIGGYVYTASAKKLSRNSIISGSSLGAEEVLADLTALPGFSTCDISSFTRDQNGSTYLALKNHPAHGLFVLESDGSLTPYYTDNIMPTTPPSIDQLIWSNGKYLYINRAVSLLRDTSDTGNYRLYRMGMEYNGAPNLGRTLP